MGECVAMMTWQLPDVSIRRSVSRNSSGATATAPIPLVEDEDTLALAALFEEDAGSLRLRMGEETGGGGPGVPIAAHPDIARRRKNSRPEKNQPLVSSAASSRAAHLKVGLPFFRVPWNVDRSIALCRRGFVIPASTRCLPGKSNLPVPFFRR